MVRLGIISHALMVMMPSSNAFSSPTYEKLDLCIIGGGASGLSAAITSAASLSARSGSSAAIKEGITSNSSSEASKIVVLEAQPTIGGRVSSDIINGYTFDRGFAVFIDRYPQSKEMFDYEALQLKPFDPGAMIKLEHGLARVADPLRQPGKIIDAIVSPVGSLLDKLKLAPLLLHVRRNSIEDLFLEDEVDTLSCLQNKYKFSEKMIQEFFEPFLTGIYFAPLNQQSSRMFHFVFKMFSEGSATLPTGGMQAASDQMMRKAQKYGVDIRLSTPVSSIKIAQDGSFDINMIGGEMISAKSVICATEGPLATKLLAQIDGLGHLSDTEQQPQNSVGSVYYSFKGETPVNDAILVLNGVGKGVSSSSGLINSAVFPHVCNRSYAPEGCGLCSVSISGNTMDEYIGRRDDLDHDVRAQLGEWFPEFAALIKDEWKLEKIYTITNAQPGQLEGPLPASAHGGRDSAKIGDVDLPPGLFVCGDYMVRLLFQVLFNSFILSRILTTFIRTITKGNCNTKRSYREWNKRCKCLISFPVEKKGNDLKSVRLSS